MNLPEFVRNEGFEKYYIKKDLLGKGSFGDVYKAVSIESKNIYAIKNLTVENDFESLISEILIMKNSESPYLINFIDCFYIENRLSIVMEYAIGSIKDLIEITQKPLREDQIATVCRSCLKGLTYLHSLKIIHRDIKAGNILITEDFHAKLTDFGVSSYFNKKAKRKTITGSIYWMAPEIILEKGYDEKIDVWSLGITLIELAELNPPNFEINPARYMFMIPNKPSPTLKNPGKFSKDFNHFLKFCLLKDNNKRPPTLSLLEHPFVSNAKSIFVIGDLIAQMRLCIEKAGSRMGAIMHSTLEARSKKVPTREPTKKEFKPRLPGGTQNEGGSDTFVEKEESGSDTFIVKEDEAGSDTFIAKEDVESDEASQSDTFVFKKGTHSSKSMSDTFIVKGDNDNDDGDDDEGGSDTFVVKKGGTSRSMSDTFIVKNNDSDSDGNQSDTFIVKEGPPKSFNTSTEVNEEEANTATLLLMPDGNTDTYSLTNIDHSTCKQHVTESLTDELEMKYLLEIQDKSKFNISVKKAGESGEVCFGCEEKMKPGELFLDANTHSFHRSCFKCVVCGDLFDDKNQFFQVQNLPFCQHHHHVLFSPTCFNCGGEIESKDLLVKLKKTWHADHFSCMVCGQRGKKLYDFEMLPYCMYHYNVVSAPTCDYCKKKIVNKDLNVKIGGEKEENYHVGCLYASKRNKAVNANSLDLINFTFKKRVQNLEKDEKLQHEKLRNFNNLVEKFQMGDSENLSRLEHHKLPTSPLHPKKNNSQPSNAKVRLSFDKNPFYASPNKEGNDLKKLIEQNSPTGLNKSPTLNKSGDSPLNKNK